MAEVVARERCRRFNVTGDNPAVPTKSAPNVIGAWRATSDDGSGRNHGNGRSECYSLYVQALDGVGRRQDLENRGYRIDDVRTGPAGGSVVSAKGNRPREELVQRLSVSVSLAELADDGSKTGSIERYCKSLCSKKAYHVSCLGACGSPISNNSQYGQRKQ